MTIARVLAPLMLVLPLKPALAVEEDGYDLWLRYRPLAGAYRAHVQSRARAIVHPANPSLTTLAAVAELHRGLTGMLGAEPPVRSTLVDGAVVLATPESLPAIASLSLPLSKLGSEGYLIRSVKMNGHKITLIAANSDIGALYGAFAWLRKVQIGEPLGAIDEHSSPGVRLRLLNHWDNLDRTVERGYAGESIWDWWTLPDVKTSRYVDYARANASIGINGASLNNVNAKAEILTAPWIAKAAALAEILRPYGIKVYLAVRFSAPVELGALSTADPQDKAVQAWWTSKTNEIYRAIPDFGGFLVKANSEGQPGPQDYGRSHAEGANLLAQALAPHGGVVFWRAFVYSQHDPKDRAAQAFDEFKPLDGQFAANVIVQVKNGPIDFQPREPFHPLFGAMPKTPLAIEFQITKEYLGFATHLAYLGTMYEEVLKSDTYVQGKGSTVAKVVNGQLHHQPLSAMAGVANIGSDRRWSGSHFDQANWYVFGRLAWNPQGGARAIAREWAAQTLTNDSRALTTIVKMMMESREAVVNYMTPLGLHHLMDTGHHYGPGPWVGDLRRPDWNPTYYHQADVGGVGFDRSRTGSGAVSQYAPFLVRQFDKPESTPDDFLLWFHHLPWSYKLSSGRELWDELVARYDQGVAAVALLRKRWSSMAPFVDASRHEDISAFLAIQEREALWWRDACLAYFQSVSQRPYPVGTRVPPATLDEYKLKRFPFAPGRGG